MKKLTAKQRAKIYRKAADEFQRKQAWTAVCTKLHDLSDRDRNNYTNEKTLARFPEFASFKPEINEFGGLWWGRASDADKYNLNVRITALLLCEQIALNP